MIGSSTSTDANLFARFGLDIPRLGVDRRNEVACQASASALGIAPRPIHQESGLLISEYLEGRTLNAEDVQSPECLGRLAITLGKLHSAWNILTGEMLYFSAFQAIRTYAASATALGAALPADIDNLVDDTNSLARQIHPFTPVLCHNDLLAANILDDGDQISLVDWEYAGIGHPLFDLAGVSANCQLNEDQEQSLLVRYLGHREPTAQIFDELHIFKVASLLRDALWACIQSKLSTIEYDYDAYAANNFEAYRRVRGQLGPRIGVFHDRPLALRASEPSEESAAESLGHGHGHSLQSRSKFQSPG